MAERPSGGPGGPGGPPDRPEYDWLYGARRPGSDPDHTRLLPTAPRPGGASRPPSRPEPPPDAAPRMPAPAEDRPRTRTRRSGPGWRRWVLLAMLAWLVFLVAVPIWAWQQVGRVDAGPGGDRPADQPGTTYLLVGSDSREGLTREEQLSYGTGRAEGRRTDTIMLLHTGAGPNLLMSIPRDSIVEVPGVGTTKVNGAYSAGGPELLVETLEAETGIRIDDYVEIGFGGFVDVVDAVGGVEICPTEAMQDPQANLDIGKGCQEVGGVEALGYARSRKTSSLGDIDRARHQREVVAAIGSAAVSPWTVLNPWRYVSLARAGSAAVTVGRETSLLSAARFAWAMTRVSGESGLTCGVPIRDLAVNWDEERSEALFALIREDRTDEVTRNLCGASGLPGR